MRITGRLRKIMGSPIRRKLERQAAEFRACTANCREMQLATLRRLIALNAESRFGRERHLQNVRSVSDLRARVPVTNYDFYSPYIDDLKQGDSSALLGPENRLLMFSLTSGTTSASKFIPITSAFLKDYRSGWQIWGVQAFNAHPETHVRNVVQINSDHNRFRTRGGIPCGNISGLVAVAQRRIVRLMYTVPVLVAGIANPEAKCYTAMRFAVADDNIGMIATANPATLIRLAGLADEFKEELIRDIHDGTLSEKFEVASEIRHKLLWRTSRRKRRRAKELEQIIEKTGRLYPRDYWPSSSLLAVWTGGSCGAYLTLLRKYFGEMPIRDHGLSASEGRMTIPMCDEDPRGVLEINTHFFEFIPESEYGQENAAVLEAHELAEGENYYILLTTSSGFYRYDICDVVQCVGFYQTAPLLKFLHKGAHISSITGEKLSESQVVEAVHTGLKRSDVRLGQFSVVPVWGEPPGYRLLIEEDDAPSRFVLEQLSSDVDQQLQQLNCEYAEKRSTARLTPLEVVLLRSGAWSSLFRARSAEIGGSVEQYKHPCLIPDMEASAQLLQEYAVPKSSDSSANPMRSVRLRTAAD